MKNVPTRARPTSRAYGARNAKYADAEIENTSVVAQTAVSRRSTARRQKLALTLVSSSSSSGSGSGRFHESASEIAVNAVAAAKSAWKP